MRADSSYAIHARQNEELRKNSKAMFGSSDRLPVALAIAAAEDGAVNATDLSWDLRLANNRVRAQLVAMADLGLLQAIPPDSGGKRWYTRVDSPFWDVCVDLYERWRSGQP